MAFVEANGVRLFYQITGAGAAPLVLVHGSWVSHAMWGPAATSLGRSFRVVTFDRRGHSASERPPGQGSVREDVADLAALVEALELAPAWVAGNSFGAAIALRLAVERGDLLRGVIAHEPPLFTLLAGEEATAPMLDEVGRRIGAVTERIRAGDHAGAAELFVETVAFGRGAWETIEPEVRQTMIENAPTFLDETRDPEALAFDLSAFKRLSLPCLLSSGDRSPPAFAPVIAKLAATLPNAEIATFTGAGHIPHTTHTESYVETIAAFIRKHN